MTCSHVNSFQVLTKVLPEAPASSHRPEEEVLRGGGVADSVFTHNELCASGRDWSPSQDHFLRVSVSSSTFLHSLVSALERMESGFSIKTGQDSATL